RGAVLVAAAALVVFQAGSLAGWQPKELLEEMLDTPAYQVVSWPVQAFIEAALADTMRDLLLNLLIASAFNLVLVGVIFGLDAHYLETSANVSAKRYAMIQRLRGKQV